MNPDDLVTHTPRPATSRWAIAGWTLAALSLVALGVLWQLDRTRHWEAPRWERAQFEPVFEGVAVAAPAETWVVAFNPECPHCRASLAATLARRDRTTPRARVALLVVDTPARPDSAALAALGADLAWWDAARRWRRAWGHRVYGEVLRFDERGAWLETLPPKTAVP